MWISASICIILYSLPPYQVFNRSCLVWTQAPVIIVDAITPFNQCTSRQGCGAGTLQFLAPAPTSKSFGFQNNLVDWKPETIVLLVKLALPTNHVCGTGTQLSAPAPPFKIAQTPAPQPCSVVTWQPPTLPFLSNTETPVSSICKGRVRRDSSQEQRRLNPHFIDTALRYLTFPPTNPLKLWRHRFDVLVRSFHFDVSSFRWRCSSDGDGGSHIRLWTVNGSLVAAQDCKVPVLCVTFSSAPEGRAVNVLAGGLRNGSVRLWSSWDLAFVRDVTTQSVHQPIVR